MNLDRVYPWGRNFDEYRRMFALTDADMQRDIVGCADGPAAFIAEMARRGHRAIACDPLYVFSADAIARRIEEATPQVMDLTRRNADGYVWDRMKSPENLLATRLAAMRDFLADFAAGRAEGRYIAGALPRLPLATGSFGLALCSHFLFTYSDEFSLEFHAAAIEEMTRVAGEARVFPLTTMDGRPSPHLPPLLDRLAAAGLVAECVPVDYEFQRGADRMLRVRRA